MILLKSAGMLTLSPDITRLSEPVRTKNEIQLIDRACPWICQANTLFHPRRSCEIPPAGQISEVQAIDSVGRSVGFCVGNGGRFNVRAWHGYSYNFV